MLTSLSKIGNHCFVFLVAFILFLTPVTQAAEKELALFPIAFYIDSSKDFLKQGIRSMLMSRLSGEGIRVVDKDRIDPILNDNDRKGITSKERAADLAKSLKAQYAIFGSITSIGVNYSLDLAILDISKPEPELTRIAEIVNENELIPKLGALAQQFKIIMEGRLEPGPKSAQTLKILERAQTGMHLFELQADGQYAIRPTGFKPMGIDFMACDTGDLDGDGEMEIIILGRDKLQIFHKKDETLELKGSLKSGLGKSFITVSVGDTDQNGKAEICVIRRSGEARPLSMVYEWTGKFVKRYEQTGHLQIATSQTNGKSTLLFQDSSSIDFFSGGIWVVVYQAGKLVKKEELEGLDGAQFYTLTFYDLNGDGKEEILGLGRPDLSETAKLYVWDHNGEYIWRSENRFGGTNNYIRLSLGSTEQGSIRVPFNSKPLIADVNGDGNIEVLMIKGTPSIEKLENLKIFVKSNLTAFEVDGIELFSSWTSKNMDYCITGMQMAGQTLFLVGHKGHMSNFGKQVGRIMWVE